MKLHLVANELDQRAFRDLTSSLPGYAGRQDFPGEVIDFVFDPERNGYFDRGDARRWILRSAAGLPLGRIAAFYRRREGEELLGGIGFLACVDDDAAGALLFEAAEAWLVDEGAVGFDGPINFGERDRCYGLLVSGFESPSTYLDDDSPPHLARLFFRAGYRPRMESYTFRVMSKDVDYASLDAAFARGKDPAATYRFESLETLGARTYAEGMFEVYSAAFPAQGRARHWSSAELAGWLESDATLDPRWLYLAYVDDAPAALLGYQPDLNQLADGRSPAAIDRLKGFVVAVHPDHQRSGVLAGVGVVLQRALAAAGFREVAMTGIGGHGDRIRGIVETLGGVRSRVHATFRRYLDSERDLDALPMPIWGEEAAALAARLAANEAGTSPLERA